MFRARVVVLSAVVAGVGCGAPPPAREAAPVASPHLERRADAPDDCAPKNGEPAEPLVRTYRGVAAAARCQREVYSIMGGVTHALGVKCDYCHAGEDYARTTHRKQIANWMASELVPSLSERGGDEVWCGDCHRRGDRGTAKILGEPRRRPWAIEWMTTHLVERFASVDGARLRCKDCHVGNFGTPEFRAQVILARDLVPEHSTQDPGDEPGEAPDHDQHQKLNGDEGEDAAVDGGGR